MNSALAHNADADVDMTFSMAETFANGLSLIAAKLERTATILKQLAPESSIIDGFMNGKNRTKLVKGKTNSFNPQTDTITLNSADINSVKSRAEFIQVVEHEIVHAYTAAMIQQHYNKGPKSNDVAYIEKALNQLDNKTFKGSKEVLKRIAYIKSFTNPEERMAEFMAVMIAEPKVALAIYNGFSRGDKLRAVINNVVKRIRTIISRATEQDVLSNEVDAEQLYSSLNAVFEDGKTLRETKYDTTKELQSGFNRELNYGPEDVNRVPDNVLGQTSYTIDKINQSVAEHVIKRAEEQGSSLVSNLDKLLKVNMPAYRRMLRRANKFYDDSPALQQVMHKITNGNINQLKKNEILSLFQKISGDKDTITSKELVRFKDAMKDVSEVDVKAFEDFSRKASLTDYFAFYPNGIADIDAEIDNLEKGNWFSNKQLSQINQIVDFNVNDVFNKTTPYNLHEAGMGKGAIAEQARKLLLLKSIKAIGVNRFRDLIKNDELMNVTRDNLMANANILAQNSMIHSAKLRDNGLVDEYKEPVVFKAISEAELKYYDDNKDWVVLRKPTAQGPGVVYQTVIDSTFQTGVFTSIQMNSGDIDTSGRFRGQQGVASVDNEFKIILTEAEKRKAGLITNPAQSIVRTMTNNMAIQDSNVIREKLLQKDTYYQLNTRNEEELVKKIKAGNQENPWFLNDVDDRDFETLHPAIKARYMRIPTAVSNVDGFDQRVKYVRKDIGYWLVGASEKSIANNRTVQKSIRVVKDLIAGTKIGMVILNPIKIAKDNVFNFVYLVTLGVDPVEVSKRYGAVASEFNEYQELKDRIQSLRVRAYAEPEGKYDAQLDKLVAKLEAHPMNGVVERGFVNSLGSEIVMQEDSPGSGFKSDIDKALKTILQDNKGKNNALGRLIMKVANTPGLSMEGLLEVWSKPFKSFNSTKNVEGELMRMSERVADIKTNEDVVAYMHQYLNSPDSEFVKLGTHMTDLTDVLAKETYYRHLVETQNMDPKKAEMEVITSFPDYKEGLPTSVQKLDSVGILMFPQYWMRMIQAMYRLAENRPASFGSEMLLAQLMNTQSQLWSQTIFDKAFSNWGLVHNPTNHIGMGSIVPTNVF